MKLTLKPADDKHRRLAEENYLKFVEEHVIELSSNATFISDVEATKFQENWNKSSNWSIQVDDKPIGWVGCIETQEEIFVENIFLEPVWQNKGIGQRILQGIVDSDQGNKKALKMRIWKNNPIGEALVRTAKSCGFLERSSDGHYWEFESN